MIYDFAGFGVTQGKFAFGDPTRYLPLDAEAATSFRGPSGAEGALASQWDSLLDRSAAKFEAVGYNFVTTNCHSFVQYFLRAALYSNSRWWGTVKLVCPRLSAVH
jgi:hypothetical protein